jgi:hypothetical protein
MIIRNVINYKIYIQENVDLYIRSPIRLHGILFNYLSTGTTLPYLIRFKLWRVND